MSGKKLIFSAAEKALIAQIKAALLAQWAEEGEPLDIRDKMNQAMKINNDLLGGAK